AARRSDDRLQKLSAADSSRTIRLYAFRNLSFLLSHFTHGFASPLLPLSLQLCFDRPHFFVCSELKPGDTARSPVRCPDFDGRLVVIDSDEPGFITQTRQHELGPLYGLRIESGDAL